MKTCFKCKAYLPLSGFYRHPETADGHLGKCKNCTKEDTRLRRAGNPERNRAYSRKYATSEAGRAAIKARYVRYKACNMRQAHYDLTRAVIEGRLVRQPCETCGKKADAHHDDYSRPLEVRWLCRTHHAAWHLANGPGAYRTNYDHYT